MVNSAQCILIIMLCMACGPNSSKPHGEERSKPNIVFIAIDDLRPDLGCYGHSLVHSPHTDNLSRDGIRFNNHYVNVPTCGASRFCLITGRLPVSRAHLRNSIIADSIASRPPGDQPESFFHHLRKTGYYTVGIGKISHMPDGYVYGYLDPPSAIRELPYSWDEFEFDNGPWGTGHHAFFGYADGSNRNTLNKQVLPYEAADVDDSGYPDGLTTNLALEKLDELNARNKPFLLAVGFFKPHLPFNAPKAYWDLYDREAIDASPQELPANVHPVSLHSSGEFNQYALGPEKASLDHNLSGDYTRLLKHAYYACISYIDAQIGKIIERLKALQLYDDTLIVLWGDHGWHLGEHRVWGKHTLFERSLKSPLILKLPNSNHRNRVVSAPVSTIDIYPTLLDICQEEPLTELHGRSLLPLIDSSEPYQHHPSYSYFRNGITMKSGRYRLTKYYRTEQPQIELYDHMEDPGEMTNIANKFPEIVDSLELLLDAGDTGLYSSYQE